MKKSTSIALLILVLVFTAAWTATAFVDIPLGRYDHIPFSDDRAISKGLDLNGGVYAVYQAVNPDEEDLADKIQGTISIMRQRLDNAGYTEATITQQGTTQIRVEIPSVSDPDEVLSIIGKPAKLEFTDPDGNIIIDGSNVVSAEAGTLESMESVVYFTLNDDGAKKFSEATARLAATKSTISIMLDGKEISSPIVNTHIGGGQGYIEGNFTAESAKQLAMLIQSGALPLDIEQIEVRTISATLGVDALSSGIMAAAVGVGLVLLFMLLYYRLPGLVADVSLVLYIMLVLTCVAEFGVQLTLPGIAGIILGVGMAVDANVVIYERIKEELRAGKTIRSAVDAGFHKAATAIADANITTIIASVVLMALGTGPVKGFAYTLFIGIVASMFTALVITRFLLKILVSLNIGTPWAYGVSKKSIQKEAV